MRGVAGVSGGILQQGVHGRRQGSGLGQAGKYGAVADIVCQYERWPLRDLQSVKFGGGRAEALLNFRGLRPGQ